MRTRLALVVCLTSAACGSATTRMPVAEPVQHTPVVDIDISKASMPYKVLRTRGGKEISPETFFTEIGSAAGVCVGESHTNPHHHWAQLEILRTVIKRRGGRVLGLGLEMFQQPFQGVLDDFAAGHIDEDELLTRSGWAERWGFDFALYRPIIDLAVASKVALVALNITTELRRKAAREGLDSLTEAERASLPRLVLDDEEHRAWFDEIMARLDAHGQGHGHGRAHGKPAGHPPTHGGASDIYLAQVLWDESMAEAAAEWLAAGKRRQIIILAGNGHCHDTAIVKRMRRRGAGIVVSVRPIIDDGQGNVAEELARPRTDYLFVMVPER